MKRVLAMVASAFICFGCAAPSAEPPAAEYSAPQGSPAYEALAARIRAGEMDNIHSLLVFKNGAPIAEYYFTGDDEVRGAPRGRVTFDKDTLHDARSITKSVTSLVFGIAQSEGKIGSLDTPVLDYFPEYRDLQTPERRKITLRHLLSMTTGLKWDENSLPYSDARNSERMMDAAKDPLRYALEQEIVTAPGSTFQYNGGSVAVAAAIIERTTKMKLDAYADRVLFTPMGITKFVWLKDDRGVPFAASGLRLRPRDLGKIGIMVSQQGMWEGKQIVPAAWIAEATTPHAIVGGDDRCGVRYGYFWWLGGACVGPIRIGWTAGIGYGGQRLWVVPEQKIVIVSNAGMYPDPKQSDKANAVFSAALRTAMTQ